MAVSGTEAYTATYTYDNGNRLTKESRLQNNGNVTTTYTYDNNGNTIGKNVNGVSTTYSYNGFNQQISVTSDGKTAQYAYNTQGIRTVKAVDGSVTKFYLDGGNVVGETTGTQTVCYLRGLNLIHNGSSYYLFNAHADVVNLTNASGTVTKTYSYDAFGVEKNPSETDTNHFRYCGEYWDVETETYYLRARYYDPALGRFTQQDDFKGEYRDPLSLNYYTYCGNNPILYCDPSGHFLETIWDIVSAIFSGYTYYKNPTAENYFDYCFDVTAIFIPFVAGGAGILKAVDDIPLNKIDDLWDTGKSVLKAADCYNAGKALGNQAKKTLRSQANNIIKKTSSEFAELALKNPGQYHVHHVIPLEWVHLFDKSFNPNDIKNLVGVDAKTHYAINKIWSDFRQMYKDTEPTIREILEQVNEVEKKYGKKFIRG